jgi:pyruvate/2-oxoglutarate dehydrogenase complex dihydrolipoamide dehydrogenase (E3) component
VQVGQIQIDMAKVRQRKRDIVDSFRSGSERRLRDAAGLELIFGTARFEGPHTVAVQLPSSEVRRLAAPRIFINVGARPAMPPIPGLVEVAPLNSTTIMELDEVPAHLIVLGGGYVGLEFGQMFRRFGSNVTIVQRRAQLLDREDPDIADEVAKILRQDGIDVLLHSDAVRAERGADGRVHVTVRSEGAERTLEGSHVLAAAGRAPNSDSLELDAAGIEADQRGFIRVNERLETNVPGVYALGDVKGGPAFTHISYDDFRIIKVNLIDGGNRTTTDRLVPYTVYIDPQLGRIGLSEVEASAEGRRVRVAKMPMTHVARALEVDEPRGLMKAIVDGETDQILGCAVLGIEGGEVMAMMQLAMMGRLPFTALRDGVFAHPSLAESLNNLFGSLA